jgi:hypothetical protein
MPTPLAVIHMDIGAYATNRNIAGGRTKKPRSGFAAALRICGTRRSTEINLSKRGTRNSEKRDHKPCFDDSGQRETSTR